MGGVTTDGRVPLTLTGEVTLGLDEVRKVPLVSNGSMSTL